MGSSVGGNKGFVSEINVTPFVDVMLVLLIIFMVTAPMMTEGLDVDLPQTRAVETLPTESDNMLLTVRKDGAIFLDSYEVGAGRAAGQNQPARQAAEQAIVPPSRQGRGLRPCRGRDGAHP